MLGDAEMQTRKLQKVGGSTYTVSVPKRWARDQDLAAGDEIHLYAHDDDSLVVRSSQKDGGDLVAAEIEVERSTPEAVERAVRTAYAAGFEEIALVPADSEHAFTPAQRRAADELAKRLVGTETVAADPDRIAVRNLLDPSQVSVEQSLIQLQFATLSMHRAATAAATRGEDPDRVAERDGEADRLFGLVTRHFSRSLTDFAEVDRLGVGRPRLFAYYRTARQLRHVADRAVEIARAAERLGDIDGETADELAALGDAARRVVEDATDAVIGDGGADPAREALDLRDEAVADAAAVERALTERATDGAPQLVRVLDALVRTADHGGSVAGVAVESALRDAA